VGKTGQQWLLVGQPRPTGARLCPPSPVSLLVYYGHLHVETICDWQRHVHGHAMLLPTLNWPSEALQCTYPAAMRQVTAANLVIRPIIKFALLTFPPSKPQQRNNNPPNMTHLHTQHIHTHNTQHT